MTHPKLHRLFAIAFLLLASNDLFSQQLLLKGRVIDRHTEEPLPFVNVYLQGTTIGTTTNLEGFYSLISKKISDTLVASAIGYDKGKKNVTEKAEQILNFKLDRSNINLSEVVILAGENPAHEILRNIIDNKAGNNKESLDFYQFEVYNKLELDIDDISDEFMQKKYFRPFSFIFENIDSMSEEKPFLPVFLTESLSDFYFRANPHSQKEIIKASKISGVKNESVTQFLGSMYQDINIYDNWIPVLGKTFISPISASGFYYYKYYLIDSAFIDNYWCYQINFKPKHKGDNTFIGDFWVNDTTYAIKKISMQVDENVNLNFVERLSVFQEFIPVDSIWMLKKDKLIIDFITTDKTPGLIGRKATSYDKFNINDSTTNNIFRETQDIIVSEDVFDKDESFWQQARHEELTDNEEKIYALVDTLKSIPLFKTYLPVVTILVSGYYIVGKVEIGPYFNIFSGFYRRRIPQKLIRIEEKKVFYNREWNFGYSNKLSFSNRIINPYFDFEYIRGGDTPNQDTVTILNTSEVLFNARFAYHEKFVSGEFSRISLGTKYPVIQLQYTKGLRDVLESQFDYHKIEVNISDNFSINPIGTFYFIIEGGKVIGTLPYLLLEVHPGNETYFYSKHAFNNMNLYEFISDTYAKIYVSHHFGGFLFNKIPGVRKLKLRSLVAGKAVIGNINPANLANNTTDINTFTIPYPIPYMEVGGGIENILKILRLDATWRLNYFTGPNVTPFSVRLSLQLEF